MMLTVESSNNTTKEISVESKQERNKSVPEASEMFGNVLINENSDNEIKSPEGNTSQERSTTEDHLHPKEVNDKTGERESQDSGLNRSKSPDSGQDGSGKQAGSVDGREKGFHPGASTEAAVSAKKLSEVLHIEENNKTTLSQLKQKIGQLLGQNNQFGNGEKFKEEFTPVKIQIKSISPQEPVLVPRLQISTQQILFESGLAEHFARLLTDTSAQSHPAMTQLQTSGTSTISQSGTSAPVHNLVAIFSAEHSENSEILNRTVQIIRTNLGMRQSRLTVQLDPPDLGKMNIDVRLIDSNLALTIRTETNHAKEALSQKLDSLRNTLQQQGIHVTRFEVVARNAEAHANHNNAQYHHQFSQQSNQSFREHQENNHRENHITEDHEKEEPLQQITLDMQNQVNLVA